MEPKTSVLAVDIEACFTEARAGSLAVPGTGEDYIIQATEATEGYKAAGLDVFAVMDWHPADHVSFVENHPGNNLFDVIALPDGREQILWPAHCIAGTGGATILLPDGLIKQVVKKGSDPRYDSYSAFEDDGGQPTGLDDVLRAAGTEALIIYGLATDYCVHYSALHARQRGYRVSVRLDLCRGVAPDSTARAIKEMGAAGIEILGRP